MSCAPPHPYQALFEREIQRFREYAELRSTKDVLHARRRHKRVHRSWPLLIAVIRNETLQEYSAALHDASPTGIGFMSDHEFMLGERVYIKLFWHEAAALRIPSIVRHLTPHAGGLLIGTEFELADLQACEDALTLQERWL
ncbi:MAG: hypothetical protein HJJLKODD_01464 [Phycisphaerae bacterium]|nr:hypothetical protein [Phycisphaerae bacterium]